ncbi:MAG: alpha/beta fold hydrolase [Nocardioides sp.]
MPIDPHAEPFSADARPEDTEGRRIGVLLSHGFTGSPFSMRPWGAYLAERGYAVEVPRLPGHGTSWQEMNATGWSDWYGEVERSFTDLRDRCDAVVVAGLSMGGALVLRLAADRPADVAGIVVVNPAVKTLRKDVLALPVLKHVVKAFPAIANDIKRPGQDEHAYPKTPLKAAHSMMQAWVPLRQDLPRVTAPLLYFRSSVDHVVDDSSEPVIVGSVSSTDVTVHRLEDSYHVATLDNDAETVFGESADFVARVTG